MIDKIDLVNQISNLLHNTIALAEAQIQNGRACLEERRQGMSDDRFAELQREIDLSCEVANSLLKATKPMQAAINRLIQETEP